MTNSTASVTPRAWVPIWETGFWQDPKLLANHAPFKDQNWAFSHRHGVPIILEAKWNHEKDDKGRVIRWLCTPGTVKNFDKDLPITWAIVQAAVAESRATGCSMKEAVARLVDTEDVNVPRAYFINFAAAPEVKCAAPGEVEKQKDGAAQAKAADEFWLKIKGKPKPAAKG